jgi:hypothetical protein
MSELLGVSLRTFFRKKAHAIEQFMLILQALGYDEDFFEKEYAYERWFMSVYDNCVSRETNAEEQLNKQLIRCMFNEISGINTKFNTYIS